MTVQDINSYQLIGLNNEQSDPPSILITSKYFIHVSYEVKVRGLDSMIYGNLLPVVCIDCHNDFICPCVLAQMYMIK